MIEQTLPMLSKSTCDMINPSYSNDDNNHSSLHSKEEYSSKQGNDSTSISARHTAPQKCKSWLFYCIPQEDLGNILLLIFLYTLQGIPLGLTDSVPFLLISRQASYSQQGTFSFATWPFSLKLLWAPLVDSIYWSRLGRRKSWLIPVQYMMGFIMLIVSFHVEHWLGDNTSIQLNYFNMSSNITKTTPKTVTKVQIFPLTISFLLLYFLSATQDVAVDGWAITMLRKKNVGWASSCNAIGHSCGIFLAYVLFLSLNSKEFCNRWLRKEPKPYGLVNLGEFILAWAIIVFVANTLVLVCKKEVSKTNTTTEFPHYEHSPNSPGVTTVPSEAPLALVHSSIPSSPGTTDESEKLEILSVYKMLWKIICLRPIQLYILTLFLLELGQAPFASLTKLKMVERGVAQETLALLGSFTTPIGLFMPFCIGKYVSGNRPLTFLLLTTMCCTLYGLGVAVLVHFIPSFRHTDGEFPYYFFVILCILEGILEVLYSCMFVSAVAFHAKISDPLIGGTYMTLLNTAANLAARLPATVVMYLVDPLSRKTCISGTYQNTTCIGQEAHQNCLSNNGECVVEVEGYYILMGCCTVIGVIAIPLCFKIVRRLERLDSKVWYVMSTKQ